MNERLVAALADRYRIERELGMGGMATVYLAEDVKHKRHVAVKVLKPELAAVLGAERFVQEITTTAALQHPHILPLFDSGTAEGFLYYVMPFIDGETLRARLDRDTQLGVDDAVQITRDVAAALDYAHQHGVIHRDIKPENILLANGRPMVADFGIALAVSAAAGGRMTETGLSLGTPHYMSPEQATAEKEITARADIYSLGSVLYEMLTGDPPHTGATAQQIIMKIVTEEAAPVTKLRKAVPPNVAAAVMKSIERLAADRFATAKEFADALANPGFTVMNAATQPLSAQTWSRQLRAPLPATLAVLSIALAAVAVALASRRTEAPARPVARFTLSTARDQQPVSVSAWPLTISPDGQVIAYAGALKGGHVLYVRRIDEFEPRPLIGTEGARGPIFSPDSKWLAFLDNANVLKRIPIGGGSATPLAKLPEHNGISWSGNDDLIIGGTTRQGLFRIPASGGTLEPVTQPDSAKGENHIWPHILPDNETILFTLYSGSKETSRIAVASLKSGQYTVSDVVGVVPLGYQDGRLVYVKVDGAIMAVNFDLRARRSIGAAVPVMDGIVPDGNGNASVFLGANGSLVYETSSTKGRLAWRDSRGLEIISAGEQQLSSPRVSPDGQRIAVTVTGERGDNDIWLYDIPSQTMTKFTTDGKSDRAEWSADGTRVLYYRTSGDSGQLWQQRTDGSAPPALLTPPNQRAIQGVLTPDGRTVVYRTGLGTSGDIWMMPLTATSTPIAVQTSPFNEYTPTVSPDGRSLAFESTRSGIREVSLAAFPGPGPAVQISAGGGVQPRWSRDGRTVFYRSAGRLIAARLAPGTAVRVTSRDTLFDFVGIKGSESVTHTAYDIGRDGRALVVALSVQLVEVTVVLNWMEEVKARTSVQKR